VCVKHLHALLLKPQKKRTEFN